MCLSTAPSVYKEYISAIARLEPTMNRLNFLLIAVFFAAVSSFEVAVAATPFHRKKAGEDNSRAESLSKITLKSLHALSALDSPAGKPSNSKPRILPGFFRGPASK